MDDSNPSSTEGVMLSRMLRNSLENRFSFSSLPVTPFCYHIHGFPQGRLDRARQFRVPIITITSVG